MDLRCTDIEIVDDAIRESQELFAVILSSSDQSVNILKSLGVIEIIDTSGMYTTTIAVTIVPRQ